MTLRKEFGDFQTPLPLAREIITLIDELIGRPDTVIEPMSGLGSFLDAAHAKWRDDAVYQGFEVNPDYVAKATASLSGRGIQLNQQDFFDADWKHLLKMGGEGKTLIVGNPPWVTNSTLGVLSSSNLPTKTNFQGLRGFDAKTGKANFDIAEWMLIRLIEALPSSGALAMLCKTMTARKVLRHFWKTVGGLAGSSLFLIDAKHHFDVSVDACLFMVRGKHCLERTAIVYSKLSSGSKLSEFGLVDGHLVSDADSYREYRNLGGGSPYTWRSGIKHDASSIMELVPYKGHYRNGLEQDVVIEPEFVYPLLKSSDLGNQRTTPRKAVLVTQKRTGDQTDQIKKVAPKTWQYLETHADKLDGRKSSIYKNRPRFSIFGIGNYSFSPWKVAISGLYKSFHFVAIAPRKNRPVMVDDTCYFIPCSCESEANLLCDLFNSEPSQRFLSSLSFEDSKRPITIELLRRISIVEIARRLGKYDELCKYIQATIMSTQSDRQQMILVMEKGNEYKTRYSSAGLR
jgi:hypothetical protein